MTEDEFWLSTAAKVMALYRVQIHGWAKTRDSFPARLAAIKLNSYRQKDGERVWTAEDFLAGYYPLSKSDKRESVMITSHDPDHGALGGEALRSGLKGLTNRAKNKRSKLRVNHA